MQDKLGRFNSELGFNSKARRGRSLAPSLTPLHVLHKGISTVDFGQMSLVDEETDENQEKILKIPTKFPPPPYLPGEVERRAVMMCTDSETERQNARTLYE